MPYVIHGARGSGSSIVELACAELDVDYSARDLDARNGEHWGEAYAAINPARKLPTLEYDGHYLTETVAILVTLDERHPAGQLLPPRGQPERAQAIRWLAVMATEFYSLVELMDHPERFVPQQGRQGLHDRAKELWQERWRYVEASAAGSPYFLSSGFSAVDLYMAALSRWDLDPQWRRETLPKIEGLWLAANQRPRLGPVFRRHFPNG